MPNNNILEFSNLYVLCLCKLSVYGTEYVRFYLAQYAFISKLTHSGCRIFPAG